MNFILNTNQQAKDIPFIASWSMASSLLKSLHPPRHHSTSVVIRTAEKKHSVARKMKKTEISCAGYVTCMEDLFCWCSAMGCLK
jgi:hypothetical protein